MEESVFRARGVSVVVDTTSVAEFDIADLRIADDVAERIGRQLYSVPFSIRDRVINGVRVRLIEGYDVIFVVGREPHALVVTIGGLRLPDPENPTERLLQKLETIAMFRGVTGL